MDVEVLHEGRVINLCRRGTWEFASRRNVKGVVGIIAVTDEGKLLLVEQFRPPVNCATVELPAGLAGDHPGAEDEETAAAARRELEEETGYACREMEAVATGAASAGLCDEVLTLYRARGLRKVHDGPTDASERITLHEVPLPEVESFLRRARDAGKQVDLKVYSALYFAGR